MAINVDDRDRVRGNKAEDKLKLEMFENLMKKADWIRAQRKPIDSYETKVSSSDAVNPQAIIQEISEEGQPLDVVLTSHLWSKMI